MRDMSKCLLLLRADVAGEGMAEEGSGGKTRICDQMEVNAYKIVSSLSLGWLLESDSTWFKMRGALQRSRDATCRARRFSRRYFISD